MDYSRQNNIFNPANQKSKIIIIGAGSVGSLTAFALAKTGFKDITCIDDDIVEEANIPCQIYSIKDIGLPKVGALKQMLLDYANLEINAVPKKVEEGFEFEVDSNTIVIVTIDNMEGRKLIYNALKDYPIRYIDSRMGGLGYSIYSMDFSDTSGKLTRYEKSLELETVDLPCGEKSICPAVMSLASEVANIVLKIDKEEKYPFVIKRSLGSYNILNSGENENGENGSIRSDLPVEQGSRSSWG